MFLLQRNDIEIKNRKRFGCKSLNKCILRKNLSMSYLSERSLGNYKFTGRLLRGDIAIILVAVSLFGGALGYVLIENYTAIEAFYMAVISFSTVGFTEVRPLSEAGRIYTSLLIIFNIGVFAYSLSVFTYYVVQGEFFKNLHLKHIQSEIDALNDHILLCGYGRYGKEVAKTFLKHKVPFVVIEQDEETIKEIQSSELNLLYVEGNATDDDKLIQAGIKRARSLITTLPDDSDNLFIVLSANQLKPELKIVSRGISRQAEKKMRLAGADHVILPDQIGSFYMATLVNKPETVEFFSFLTDEFESDVGFEQIHYKQMPKAFQNQSIADLDIRRVSGVNIIGFKTPGGRYIVNPPPDTKLIKDSSFILLGDQQQLAKLRDYLNSFGDQEQPFVSE